MLGSTPIRLAVLQTNGIGGGRSDTYRPDCTLEYLHKVDQQVFGCPYSSKYFFMISSCKAPPRFDPMAAVVPRVKGFACYSLSFSRHNKNIKMEHFFLYILSRYFI